MNIAVVGVGALGTIVGAMLNSKGIKADLVDDYQENINGIREKGLQVVGNIEVKATGEAYHIDELDKQYDLVLLLTKQFENEKILTKLLPHLHADSIVCTLQNGAPEENVAEYVGKERTIGGAVGFGATWLGPGVSELTSELKVLENFAFEIGETNGEITERIKKVNEILQHVGGSEIMDNLPGVRWAKILMNAAFSGMSAALGCTYGEVMDDPRGHWCLVHIADETIRVAEAQGIKFVEMQGVDFSDLRLKDDSPEEVLNKFPFMKEVWGRHRKLKASMLQDLEKGRTTEITHINGVVSDKGKELGIPTPFNDTVVRLVKQKEANKEVVTPQYIDEFFQKVNSSVV